MRIRGLIIILGFLVMSFIGACARDSGAVEPSVNERELPVAGSPVLVEVEQSAQEATGLPLLVEDQNVTAGESEVVVEVPNMGEKEIETAVGEPVEEETSGANAGDTMEVAESSQPSIDISQKEGRIAFARQDLAQKLIVGQEEVELVGYENKIWPDGNLGCPQKGKQFTPAEISGYLIRLNVGGEEYAYHGGAGRLPQQCGERNPSSQTDREIILPPPDTSP